MRNLLALFCAVGLSQVAWAQQPSPAPSLEDTALLRAILAAYQPAPEEIRVLAVEDLGLLGDPRVINLLADFALDPYPAVQLAAVRALRSYQHPRAEEVLANLVRHPRPGEAVKLAALEGLAFQRTRSSLVLLESIQADSRHGVRLQSFAREFLSRAASPASSPK
ncbi:MAG: HEAT repeat domain-containing protein [Myxococcota bacterium]|nr:HEAT repeat domain-containing protein [Myxococcota bacterium]